MWNDGAQAVSTGCAGASSDASFDGHGLLCLRLVSTPGL